VLDPTYIAELNDSENISTVNGKPDTLKNVHEYNICSVMDLQKTMAAHTVFLLVQLP